MEKKTDFEQERQRLTRRAWGVTVGYGVILLVLAACVIFVEEGVDGFLKMAPNEVGDLLAGVAGPVAFIWLVYGYFLQGIAIRQQAEELQQNTHALNLQEKALQAQVDELKSSVEQQRELTEISRKQFESNLESVKQEKESLKKSSRPIFVFHTETFSPTERGFRIEMNIKNIGATITNVEFLWGKDVIDGRSRDLTTFETGQVRKLYWGYKNISDPKELSLSVGFSDLLGNRKRQIFDLIPGGSDGFFGSIAVVERKQVLE